MKKGLPNKKFRELVSFLKEEKIYQDKKPRKINWAKYNLSQIEEAKETLIFIRDIVDECEYFPYKKVGRPLTDAKFLVKAILFSESQLLTERKAQGWLEILGPFLGIQEKLDDRVIGEAYNRPEVMYILKQLFEKVKKSDGILSGDGTGLETSRKQNYGEDKKSTKEFLTSIVDSREIVQAFDFSGEDECRAMHSLVEEVKGDSLRLDAGFVDRKLTAKIVDMGMIPYIYPKKSLKLNGNFAWKLMYLEFYMDVIQWLAEYHQRSHCESFHSSFKRIYGLIRKIRGGCKLAQITARIILHNRKRLSYFNKLADAS